MAYNKFYTLTSLDYMLDLDTFKFVPVEAITDADVVSVPIYMSNYSGYTKLHKVFRQASPDHTVRLNQLQIELIGLDKELKPFGFGKHKARISFFDTIDKSDRELELTVSPYFGSSPFSSWAFEFMEGVDYTVRTPDRVKRINVDMIPLHVQHFYEIDNLPRGRVKYPELVEIMHFGVSTQQYEVVYHEKKMNGTCYAMLCGCWGILLDDDMMLDAIVLFDSIKDGCLIVEHFIYVANTYITKFITLDGIKR